MVVFKHSGSFNKTEKFLHSINKKRYYNLLKKYAQEGVQALQMNTPVDTGKTASSWGYEIVESSGSCSIYWTNSNVNNGVPIALIIQYGHATPNGGYVQGVDYINPALKPVFDKLAEKVWKEVTSS